MQYIFSVYILCDLRRPMVISLGENLYSVIFDQLVRASISIGKHAWIGHIGIKHKMERVDYGGALQGQLNPLWKCLRFV